MNRQPADLSALAFPCLSDYAQYLLFGDCFLCDEWDDEAVCHIDGGR
jgi:hypothetical protein